MAVDHVGKVDAVHPEDCRSAGYREGGLGKFCLSLSGCNRYNHDKRDTTNVMAHQEKNTTNVIFSSRLREAMDRSAVTQGQLAAKSGCTQSAVSLYLKGRIPAGDVLVSMAGALGTTAESLLGGEANSMVQEQSQTYGKRVSQADVEKVKIEIYRAVEAAFKKLEERL